jgi:NAD(P)H-dependent FMN reductase
VDIEEEIETSSSAKAIGQNSRHLVVSMAEHNGNYSASFKNVFDWCTRISGKVFQEKPCC